MKSHVVSKKNQIRSILFVVFLMLITLIVILKEYSIMEIVKVIQSVHPFFLFAGIMMMFVFVGCQALNFYLILKKLEHPAPYVYCIEYAYVGNYFGAITPGASGGQPAQLYYMNKDKIHVDLSSITVFFMVFSSQIVILLLGAVLAFLRYSMVSEYKDWLKYLLIAGSAVMIGLTLILTALMFLRKTVPFLIRNVLKLGIKSRLIKKPESIKVKLDVMVQSYQDKSRIIRKHPDLILKVFAVTIVQWISYYMVSYLVYLSFGYRNYNAIDLMTGQSLISIAVAAVPLPGSVGISENSFLTVFNRFYNIQELPSAMILTRVINFYLPLFISFTVYLIVHFRVIRQKKKEKNRPEMN